MNKSLVLAAAVTAAFATLPARAALETMVPYDSFDNTDQQLDPNLWGPSYGAVEQARYIDDSGRLMVAQRVLAKKTSNSGTTYGSYGVGFYNPATIKEIAATITVQGAGAAPCAANTDAGFSAVRVIGSFFNDGGKTANSQVNDIIAQVRMERSADSTAVESVTNVVARVDKCLSADCAETTNLYKATLRSNLAKDVASRVYLRWDQAAKTFNFKEGSQAYQKYTYTMVDTVTPSVAFKALQVRNKIENCTTGTHDGWANGLFEIGRAHV